MLGRLLLLLLLSTSLFGEPLLPSRILPKAPNALISSVKPPWAVGERGHVFRLDSGNLKQIPFPARQFLCDSANWGEHLWVVGHDALIAHRQGVSDWEVQFYLPELESPLMAVHFQSQDVGLAVGAYGLVLLTADGGKNWRSLTPIAGEPHFYSVTSDADGFWYLAGEFGTVLKLRIDGALETQYAAGLDSTFFGLELFGPDDWLSYGLRGRLVRYRDGVAKRIQNPRSSGLFASLRQGEEVFLFGADGTILSLKGEQLTDLSLTQRVPLCSAALIGDTLFIGSGEGLIKVPLKELSR